MDATNQRKSRVALLSIVSNSALVLGKIAVGLLIGSVSVLSEAAHSGVDLLASVVAFWAVREAAKPADSHHPFGHGKLENLSGMIEALLIFVAAIWIIFEAVEKLVAPKPIELPVWGVLVMAVSTGVNLAVSRALFRVGRETDSLALISDAWHLRTDVYTSAGVMGGLSFVWIAQWLFPSIGWAWVDPVVAIAVACLILGAAYQLTADAVRDLVDVSIPEQEQAWIRAHVQGLYPQVRSFHHLRTRKAGPQRFVDFHIVVDPAMTVEESHRLSHEISAAISRELGPSNTIVHIEPCNGKCSKACQEGCLLPEGERAGVIRRNGSLGPRGAHDPN